MSGDVSVILFLFVAHLWPWFLCHHPNLHGRYYCYFISTLLIYVLEYIYTTFIYNIVLYFHMLGITLFTYASQHILLIIVRWVWWALASIWMSGRSVQWQHNTKTVPCFWQSISLTAETTFSQIGFGKSDEISLCLLYCGGCREGKESFIHS